MVGTLTGRVRAQCLCECYQPSDEDVIGWRGLAWAWAGLGGRGCVATRGITLSHFQRCQRERERMHQTLPPSLHSFFQVYSPAHFHLRFRLEGNNLHAMASEAFVLVPLLSYTTYLPQPPGTTQGRSRHNGAKAVCPALGSVRAPGGSVLEHRRL